MGPPLAQAENAGRGEPSPPSREKSPGVQPHRPPPQSRLWVLPRAGRESSGTPGEEGPPSLPSAPRLADVASARLALARLFNVSASSPWICFGGSYAGSLAAWARLKVPGTLGAGWGVPFGGQGYPVPVSSPPPTHSPPPGACHQSHQRVGSCLRPQDAGVTRGAGVWGPRSLRPQADGCPPAVSPPHFRLGGLLRSGAGRAGFLGV